MVDPPRSKVSSTIRTCQASGLRVVMMTGDYPLLAETVGRGVGILRDASETADKVAARLNAPLTRHPVLRVPLETDSGIPSSLKLFFSFPQLA